MLRRSPRLTPAALAARRSNALKSTAPRTEQGKARVGLNPLQHGRYAVNLPERLARAGCRQEEAEWRAIRARIAQVFEPTFGFPEPEEGGPPETRQDTNPGFDPGFDKTGPRLEKRMDRLANWVWCSHRNWAATMGSKAGISFGMQTKSHETLPSCPRTLAALSKLDSAPDSHP
jgi:hypothetical protein